MPDLNGRMNRLELRQAIRRRVDTYRGVVDPTTGEESGTQQLDPLVTNQDLNMYINSALIKRHIDITTLDDTIMADEATVDIVADQVEYSLPDDLLFLRSVYLKPEGETYTITPPNQRTYLYEYDQEGDINLPEVGAGTYRRRLNSIVLNWVPTNDNTGGLMFDYVKSPLVMMDDTQVLETPLAWILQEVVILDCVIEIAIQKMQMDARELRLSLKEMEARLSLAAINYSEPKLVRMVPTVQLALSPVGNRRFRSWVGRGW